MNMPLSTLSRLESVSLEELSSRAALQTRIDRKYLVSACHLPALLAELDPATRVLEIDDDRQMLYRSVYFDTTELDSYLQSAQRRRRRFKVRTRTYADTGTSFLEVKTRGCRGTTVKERVEYPVKFAGQLTDGGVRYAASRLIAAGLDAHCNWHVALETHYRRTTLLVPGTTDARATIDLDLTWTAPDGRWADVHPLAVVETKSGSTPSSVDRLLWSAGHRPVQISKYGTGMAIMYPGLPSHKWHRLISQRIRPALTVSSHAPIAS